MTIAHSHPKYIHSRDFIRTILEVVGEDPNREGLRDTPGRVLRSWSELYRGYNFGEMDIEKILKTFNSPSDEIVLLKNIEFFSMCEHHMLPFLGKAHIAYIPNGRVVGISKLARLLDVYARRLQMQERICQQVADALMTHIQPKGAACILEAKHLCVSCRGVQKQHSVMVTSCIRGCFMQQEGRQELFSLIRG